MNGVDKITLREATKENYYALLLAVFLGMESAKYDGLFYYKK